MFAGSLQHELWKKKKVMGKILEKIETMNKAKEYFKSTKIYILLEMRRFCMTEIRKGCYKKRTIRKQKGSL